MSEKEEKPRSGFRIRWGDREIEYYGDSVTDVFNMVFDHVKNVPILMGQVQKTAPTTPTEPRQVESAKKKEPSVIGFDAETIRLSKDANVPAEQIVDTIQFIESEGFPKPVPFLQKHPTNPEEAVILTSYAIQVGQQETRIDNTHLKKVLRVLNGYPLAGREYGEILRDLRRANLMIASQATGRCKPFWLSPEGIEKARQLLKQTEEKKNPT